MIQNVLIVCIGNICRSPMAEALLNIALKKNHPETIVHSAGLAALTGQPADLISQELMQSRDIDISHHRARQINEDLLFSADLILTMDSVQQTCLEQKNPCIRGKVHRLGKWDGVDVPDPFQRPKIIFEQALLLIEQGVNEWHNKMWG